MTLLASKSDEELSAAKRQVQVKGQEEQAKAKNGGFTDPELVKNYMWQLNMINTVIGRRKAKNKKEKSNAEGDAPVATGNQLDQVANDNAKAPAFDDALKAKTLEDLNALKSDVAKGDKTLEGDVAEKIQQIQDEINARNPQQEALQKQAVDNMKSPIAIPTATSGIVHDALIGAGIGAVAAIILGKGLIRYALLGAGIGAGVGYIRTHQTPAPATPNTAPSASTPSPASNTPDVGTNVQNYITQATNEAAAV